MIKILIMLSFFAGSSQAADMSCKDNLGRDRLESNQECTLFQALTDEMVQVDLSRFAVTNNTSSIIASQTVLCSQCHQDFMPKRQLGGAGQLQEQNVRADSP